MSLPRILSIAANGGLLMRAAPELRQLRGEHVQARNLHVVAASRILSNVRGAALEIAIEIALGDANEIGLFLLRSPDGAEQTHLIYDRAAGQLMLDTYQSSLSAAARGGLQCGPLALAPVLQAALDYDKHHARAVSHQRRITGRNVHDEYIIGFRNRR